VFSTLGFYPVHPTAGVYVFGSPLCHEAVIHTVNGTDFKIVAKNNSSENKYIQSVTLDGQPYTKSWISHEDIMKGGEIVFEMGPHPSEFGAAREDRPFAEEIKY
jgi:putative alpha-1,2-mannosidase